MTLEVLRVPVMATRPCRFCLSLQDGSVFADFDTDAAGRVALRRISFDGFGCCEPDAPLPPMGADDSRRLLEALDRDDLAGVDVEDALRRYFRELADALWRDALSRHDLL